jgi:hypothetical protein
VDYPWVAHAGDRRRTAGSPLPEVTLAAITVAASLLSLVIVVAAYVLGGRADGEAGGVVVALWPEMVVMSLHVLADKVSAVPSIAALAVGYRPGDRVVDDGGRGLATGLLLCAATVLRPQLIPAVGIVVAWLGRLDPKSYVALAVGAAPVLMAFALIDWLTWGAPFTSIVRYVAANRSGIAA